jgi:4,5-DOPA dioxygenase extradiol
MPALYIGHGAPPLLDDPVWSGELRSWAATLPRPRVVLVVSAHWESAPVALSAPAAGTPLVYDFAGFDRRYFEMTYATPDASVSASRVAAAMPDSEPVHRHPGRGLDHGAWVPLRVMYPHGDVPVLQLSMPTLDPARLLDIGRRLRPLREEGVLVIGSGFMTNGLPCLTREMVVEGALPSWSSDFDAWVADALHRLGFASAIKLHP